MRCSDAAPDTPNGWKISILLKELSYPHEVKPISLSKNAQKEEWFLKVNPNGRIPAIGRFPAYLSMSLPVPCRTRKALPARTQCPEPYIHAARPQYTDAFAKWCSDFRPWQQARAHCCSHSFPCHAVDHDNADFPVFESGAIMMYLAEKAGKLYPEDWNKRSEVNQWMYFMNGGCPAPHRVSAASWLRC